MSWLTERVGAARATDARSLAAGLLGSLRSGPGSALDPNRPGPVAPMPAIAVRARQLVRIGTDRALAQLAVQAGARPAPPVPWTTGDQNAIYAARGSAFGRSDPKTYTYSYVADWGNSAENAADGAAAPSSGLTPLPSPCADCG